jgi:GDP-L-fucose synthase
MKKVLVTGSTGLVGSAIVNVLQKSEYEVIGSSSQDCDLRDIESTFNYFEKVRPNYLIMSAARVGGVLANSTYPATFIIDNLMMELAALNWLRESNSIERVIFVGSSCIYPLNARQPMTPDALMTGELEPTNRWYAVAKLAGIYALEGLKLEFGLSSTTILPSNLYGPRDNFHETDGHVLPSLLKRFVEAKMNNLSEVVVWGTGSPLREFLFAEDLADSVALLLKTQEPKLIYNIGSDVEISIRELATLIAEKVGYEGKIVFDSSKPDGAPRKRLNLDDIKEIGWTQTTSLDVGLEKTLKWFKENHSKIRQIGVK